MGADSRFGDLLEAVPDAMVIVDSAGSIVSVNRQTEELFGYRREELIGASVERLVPERFAAAHRAERSAFSERPTARPMGAGLDLLARRKDGTEFPADISLRPVETDQGILVTAAVRDITDRVRMRDELRRSNAELERFAAVVAHDLQEPLYTIRGFAELLARKHGAKLDAEAAEFIGIITDGAQRMQQLIGDLLAYSRVTTRAQPLAPASSEAALERALEALRRAVAGADAVVTHDPLPAVTADAGQLVQLFQNLIGNAIKFRAPDRRPQVHVAADRASGEWRFTVRDNGIGVDPHHAEGIFAIFRRLHGPDAYPGTGVGLAICKRIVERHGGRIWVESTPGRGATFHFTLPAATSERASAT